MREGPWEIERFLIFLREKIKEADWKDSFISLKMF